MLVNVSTLNRLFRVSGPEWIELEDLPQPSGGGLSPPNDIGGEDLFWNVATSEMIEERNNKIATTYNRMTESEWVQLIDHRQKNSTQRQEVELDGKTFKSKNACTRYCMSEYGVSRNTALRYISEGRHPRDSKQKGREYKGSYRGTKYL